MSNKPNAEMPRFSAEKGFIMRLPSNEKGKRISSLPPQRLKVWELYGIKLGCWKQGKMSLKTRKG